MAGVSRTDRFPASALRLLLSTRPFPDDLWKAATSASLHVRIGNAPPLTGQEAGLAALRGFFQCMDAFAEGFCEAWALKEAIYLETELDCRQHAGATRSIPCSVIARTTHGVVHDLRFYLDPTPLPGFHPSLPH